MNMFIYLTAHLAWQWIEEGGIIYMQFSFEVYIFSRLYGLAVDKKRRIMFVHVKSLVYIFSGLLSLFGSTVDTRMRTDLYVC